jgi:carbon-monoxide dehydrogenase small subunit
LVQLEVEPTRRLIDVLRDDLGLTGTKEGCSIGVCGACTVLVDGQVLSACLTLAVTISGREVLTIEGLARDGELHPLQKAFISRGGFQCGFCTPGQIMAASALLNQHPVPSDEELKEAMLGNLCRCTGYYKIVDAIRTASAEMAEQRGQQ